MTRWAYVDSCKVRPAMLADGVGGNGNVAPPGSFGATTPPVESTFLVAPDMAAPCSKRSKAVVDSINPDSHQLNLLPPPALWAAGLDDLPVDVSAWDKTSRRHHHPHQNACCTTYRVAKS